jgi:hypothetical protein
MLPCLIEADPTGPAERRGCMSDESYTDLLETLKWGATLDELTGERRRALSPLCCKIGGCVPRAELVAERKKRQVAQRRVQELETALKASREEWVFRRKRTATPSRNQITR